MEGKIIFVLFNILIYSNFMSGVSGKNYEPPIMNHQLPSVQNYIQFKRDARLENNLKNRITQISSLMNKFLVNLLSEGGELSLLSIKIFRPQQQIELSKTKPVKKKKIEYLQADSNKFYTIRIAYTGIINWSAKNNAIRVPFVVEQFRWNKWIKIGEVGFQVSNSYSIQIIPHSGENIIRIAQITNKETLFDEVKFDFKIKEVYYNVSKSRKEILFSSPTFYEILDFSERLVKKGFSDKIQIGNIPKGNYTLNFENSTVNFKK